MRLLLDTHVLIWWLENNKKLTSHACARITAATAVYVSSATIWELAIKVGAGKLKLDINLVLAEILRHDFLALPVSHRHAAEVLLLPAIHHDPFDRMLVAQAICEPLILLTADRLLAGYSALVEVI